MSQREQSSDQRLEDEAKKKLNEQVDASNIYVDVSHGEVTLRGAAASMQEKKTAEEAMRQLPGVTEVHNLLQIHQNKPLHTQEEGLQSPKDAKPD